jgi:hypothetical protein
LQGGKPGDERQTFPRAHAGARRFADRWQAAHSKAAPCLRCDLDELLTRWRYQSSSERVNARTANASERGYCRGW